MTIIFGSTEQREKLLTMNTKRCGKCNELWGVDGSHLCPPEQRMTTTCKNCGELIDTKLVHVCRTTQEDPRDTIIARQEVDLERLRVVVKQMREAISTATKALDTAREAIAKATPYYGAFL